MRSTGAWISQLTTPMQDLQQQQHRHHHHKWQLRRRSPPALPTHHGRPRGTNRRITASAAQGPRPASMQNWRQSERKGPGRGKARAKVTKDMAAKEITASIKAMEAKDRAGERPGKPHDGKKEQGRAGTHRLAAGDHHPAAGISRTCSETPSPATWVSTHRWANVRA